MVGLAKRAEEAMDLLDAEDGGQGAWVARVDEVEDGPRALQGVDKQKLDGREGDGDGARGDVFLVDEVEEVGAELILGDEVRGLARVASEPEHGLDVTGLGAGGETAKLHVLEHALP
jgi:hypothetical protein